MFAGPLQLHSSTPHHHAQAVTLGEEDDDDLHPRLSDKEAYIPPSVASAPPGRVDCIHVNTQLVPDSARFVPTRLSLVSYRRGQKDEPTPPHLTWSRADKQVTGTTGWMYDLLRLRLR